LTGRDPIFFFEAGKSYERSDKSQTSGKLPKLLQMDRDLNFLLSLEEKDLTELLIALRERIENRP
jgi:hypothetical protein